MSKPTLKVLVLQRNGYRTNVKKQIKTFQELRDAPDDPQFGSKLKIFVEAMDRYQQKIDVLDLDILQSIDDDDDEELQTESEGISEFREPMVNTMTTAQIMMTELPQASSQHGDDDEQSEASTARRRKSVKLPQLEMSKYDGDPLKWQEFWDSFESTVDQHPDLSIIDKYKYLRSLLSGAALMMIEGYRLTASNYSTVVEALKDRFGNSELAIFIHFEKLLDLPSCDGDFGRLHKVYDESEKHIRSLVALGLTEDVFGQVFTPIILSKLPKPVRIQLHRQNGSKPWKLSTLRDLMKEEMKAREMSECYSSSRSSTKTGSDHNRSHVNGSDHNRSHVNGNGSNRSNHPSFVHKNPTNSPTQWKNRATSSKPMAQTVMSNQAKMPLMCCYCKGNHYADRCQKFSTVDQRKAQLGGKCFRCLGEGHDSRSCPRQKMCFYCKKDNHHSSLCMQQFKSTPPPTGYKAGSQHKPNDAYGQTSTMLSNSLNVQMQMAVVRLDTKMGPAEARIFFDTGSSRSYITTSLFNALGGISDGDEFISVAKFSSRKRSTDSYKRSSVSIPTTTGDPITISTLVTDVITCPLPKYPVSVNQHPILSSIQLADPLSTRVEQVNVDILIGMDHYFNFIGHEWLQLADELFLLGSKLGYIVTGKIDVNDGVQASAVAMFCQSSNECSIYDNIERFWSLEDIGVKDNASQLDDDQAIESFNETVKFVDGRYQVTFPWKQQDVDLPHNRGLAYGRLQSLTNRMKPNVLAEYNKTIQHQVQKGVVEVVDPSKDNDEMKIHYIPHHCVVRSDKATTKLRIVYDASAKSSKAMPSLNDCLLRGPVILEDLCGMLIRFRLSKIAMVCDVEKAFLQVGLQPQERDVTRFLWLRDITKPLSRSNLQVLRFCRVLFGAISSPFMLGAVIKHHLKQQRSCVADDISSNLYVDNVLAGRDSVDEALKFYKEAKQLFSDISMNIREWYSNSTEFDKRLSKVDNGVNKIPKVLGLKWHRQSDALSCSGPDDDCEIKTKRQWLKCISSAYDPCGFFSPIIIRGKALVQKAWINNLPWDAEIPEDMQEGFADVKSDCARIKDVLISRLLPHCNDNGVTRELHCFCDASARAYAAACYLRSKTDNNVAFTDLVFSKARLSPIKPISLPRLELMAAVIGTRIASFVEKEIRIPIQRVFIWVDSQCVLQWIDSRKVLPVFVNNRIRELKTHPNYSFRYVPTACNPADIPSRGMDLATLKLCHLWWHGPQFLQMDQLYWPENVVSQEDIPSESDGLDQVPMSLATSSSVVIGIGTIIEIDKFSTLSRLLRVSAWVVRFIRRCRAAQHPPTRNNGSATLTVDEVEHAKHVWVKYIQLLSFGDNYLTTKSNATIVNQLGLFRDDMWVIRCRGRLRFASLPQAAREPILLPKNDPFSNMVIRHHHEKLFHAGTRQTLAHVRMRFWIPNGMSQVQKCLRQCLICRRTEGGPFKIPESPALPSFRVSQCRPFDHVGIDYMGPLYIKSHGAVRGDDVQKVWICLFTCSVIRAVHLEVVLDATAEQFLMCLRRFVALYGKPTSIISDNAKLFKSTHDAFKMIERSKEFQDNITSLNITWRFITELAPWMGGFYERLVGSVKRSLRKTVGRRCLTLTQLQTVVAEIAAVINSRPLVPNGDDVGDIALTPAHFLTKQDKDGFPSFNTRVDDDFQVANRQSTAQKLTQKWVANQKTLNEFWKVWRNEYLASLRDRPRPRIDARNSSDIDLRPGIVVLVKEDLPRSRWKLATVDRVLPSSDGQVRSVVIRLATGKKLTRSIKHLYPIEEGYDAANDPTNGVKPARTRRKAAIQAEAAIKSMADDDSDGDDQ